MGQILVTGANGFVGSALCSKLSHSGFEILRIIRRPPTGDRLSATGDGGNRDRFKIVEDIGPIADWGDALTDVDSVVHLAARVHKVEDPNEDPLKDFRRVNRDGSIALAKAAAKAGVRRFVYLSSVKVNGAESRGGAFTEQDKPDPQDPYGLSKWEAEQGLMKVATQTALEVVIVRPPLVYGPGVKANFLRLLRLAEQRIPLPLAAIENRRSLLALENLTDFLVLCLKHPEAAGETFLVSDGEDVSTPQLVRLIAGHMGHPARLIPLPAGLIRLAAGLLGKNATADRLLGSLQVDSGKSRRVLNWRPPLSLDAGIRDTVRWYLSSVET